MAVIKLLHSLLVSDLPFSDSISDQANVSYSELMISSPHIGL